MPYECTLWTLHQGYGSLRSNLIDDLCLMIINSCIVWTWCSKPLLAWLTNRAPCFGVINCYYCYCMETIAFVYYNQSIIFLMCVELYGNCIKLYGNHCIKLLLWNCIKPLLLIYCCASVHNSYQIVWKPQVCLLPLYGEKGSVVMLFTCLSHFYSKTSKPIFMWMWCPTDVSTFISHY